MKNIEKYYKGSNDYINAYEKADINKHKSIFEEAQKIWFNKELRQHIMMGG
jgi:hypothetical protein